ncbi:MAG: hypothetical protein AABZ31_02730, partial [Bdellovibrionota bacterium]
MKSMFTKLSHSTRKVLIGLLILTPVLAFQNCSDVKFEALPMSSEELGLMTDWMTINKGAKYTNDTDVLVQINVYGGQLMYLTTDPTCQS